jgi:hypothetical protein
MRASFICFSLYVEASRNYRLIITQLSDDFLCIILASTDFYLIKLFRYIPQSFVLSPYL